MRDFPMPASPEISATCNSPAMARSQQRINSPSSRFLPIMGVMARPCSASNRLSATLSPCTCQATTGAEKPFK